MHRLKKLKNVARQNPLKLGLIGLCIVVLAVVQIWKNTAPVGASGWNGKAVAAIKQHDPEDFTFAVFGDNKNGYAVFDALMNDIKTKGAASFAVVVGDMVPDGDRRNFRGFISDVEDDLGIPLVTVIGNHDLYNDSDENYREIFGAPNYHFAIGRSEFIVVNAPTQSGFGLQDRQWLETVLKNTQTADNRFVFMHVPPFDPRGPRFHKCLDNGAGLVDLFRRYHVTHLFAGHIHGYFSGVWKDVPYTITGGGGGELQSVADRKHFFHHYLVVEVDHGKTKINVMPVGVTAPTRAIEYMEGKLPTWGVLILGMIVFLILLLKFEPFRKPAHQV